MLPAAVIADRHPPGWVMSELLFAIAASLALAVLGWRMYLDNIQMAENRQKANAAIWEISAFLSRVESGPRNIPVVIQDQAGFELPGGQQAIRGGACWLDAGDTDFQDEVVAYQGVVRTCVPCTDSIPLVGSAALGSVACTPDGGGLPKRCPTQAAFRGSIPVVAGSARATAPTNTPLRQGIWIPADSLQDAVEIQHLIESNPQFSRLPRIAISRTGDPADRSIAAGLLLCV